MSQVSAPTHKSKAGRRYARRCQSSRTCLSRFLIAIRSRMPSMQRDLPPTLLADVDFLEKQGPPSSYVSASSVALTSLSKPPRPLTEPEIQDCIAAYAKAASSAVHGVGFDGVEIHNANSYLLDQFLQTVYNKRTDKWGGDKQRRTRFAQADRGRCGPRPRGYSCQSLERSPRCSPCSDLHAVVLTSMFSRHGDAGPPTHVRIPSTALRDKHPKLAYLHVIEPRVVGPSDTDIAPHSDENNDFLREI
jgi:NADPH2 dehydrogenase